MWHQFITLCIVIIVLGGGFLAWYYEIDGVYMNRVLIFKEGVNPMNLEMTQATYAPGDTPQYYTAFCKTRDAVGFTRWTLVNEHPHYDSGEQVIGEVPVGCYPLQGGLQVSATKPLPANTVPGTYHYVGVTNQVLPDGRKVHQYYQTQTFTVN